MAIAWSASIRVFIASDAFAGSALSSAVLTTTLWPLTPPRELTSFAQASITENAPAPDTPGPVAFAITPITTEPLAWLGVAAPAGAIAPPVTSDAHTTKSALADFSVSFMFPPGNVLLERSYEVGAQGSRPHVVAA